MRRTLIWLIFLFCVYKTLDTFVFSGRLFQWLQEKWSHKTSLATQVAQQTLEEEMTLYTNPQSILLASGRVVEGKIVKEDTRSITIRQHFGHTGYLDETFQRAEVEEVVSHLKDAAEVTPEEVAIKREFPQFHMFKRTDYTFFTDSDYFFIERIVTLLERLHQDFLKAFDPIVKGKEKQRSYVIIFGNQKEYQNYAKQISSALEHSAGFYTFSGRRLALYNQFQSALFGDWEQEVEEVRREIKQRQDEVERFRGRDPERAYQASEAILKAQERLGRHQQRVNAAFDETTVMVVLHEGAHQLFHATGLHDTAYSRIPWLVEGLATYCETPSFGSLNRMRLLNLKEILQKGALIPLAEFLRIDSENEFLKRGEDAYGQAWSFIYFLMQHHQSEFLRFLTRVNQPPKSFFVSKEAPMQWLEEELGKSLPEIEREWRDFIEKMI